MTYSVRSWLGVGVGVAAALAVVASCTFPDVTFTSDDSGDAPDDSIDSIPTDGGSIDAKQSVDAADASVDARIPPPTESCPILCADAGVGTCDPDGTCKIVCLEPGSCDKALVCPPGMPCKITCTGAPSCTGAIDCQNATSCEIVCTGVNSCSKRINCKGSDCDVTCFGAGSCASTVTSEAPFTTVDCSGVNACTARIACRGTDCAVKCGGAPSCTGGVCCDAGSCTGTGSLHPCL